MNSNPRVPEINEVVDAIRKGVPTAWTGNRQWTAAVKKSVGELGIKCGWGVCTSSLGGAFESEWLFDQTWYVSPNGMLREVGLVMESEWSHFDSEIKYDFEKLLVARAPLKVMVFEAAEPHRERIFSMLRDGIKNYGQRVTGECYILACWCDVEDVFEVRVEPNQSLEPTPVLGTSAAEQPLVPSTGVAHL